MSKPVARSLRIEGYATSVRLESVFWGVLEEIAAREGMTTAQLVAEIYRRVYSVSENCNNFASLLRVVCARHLQGSGKFPPAPGMADAEAYSGSK